MEAPSPLCPTASSCIAMALCSAPRAALGRLLLLGSWYLGFAFEGHGRIQLVQKGISSRICLVDVTAESQGLVERCPLLRRGSGTMYSVSWVEMNVHYKICVGDELQRHSKSHTTLFNQVLMFSE